MERRTVAVGRKQKPGQSIFRKNNIRETRFFTNNIPAISLELVETTRKALYIDQGIQMALAMQTMIANITYITTINTGKRKQRRYWKKEATEQVTN